MYTYICICNQVSNIGGFHYHIASAIGLLPAQLINVYLGSSLRSMQDVLEDRSTAATGYIVFCLQVRLYVYFLKKFAPKVIILLSLLLQILVGLSLMVYIVQKARKELQLTLFKADFTSMANSPHYILDGLPDSKIILTNLIA